MCFEKNAGILNAFGLFGQGSNLQWLDKESTVVSVKERNYKSQ